jgi:CelD/BcsL family acetyltransferase involved in cellulose biosynthesis
MKDQCRITLFDSIPKLVEIAPIWNELLKQSLANTIFLTWDWVYTWSKYFLDSSRKLFVLAVYKKEELIGLAPWCIRIKRNSLLPIRQIEFLGTPETGSDYLDVFIKKGKERDVALSIYHFLFGEGATFWDSVLLQDIPSNSLFLLYLMEQVRKDGKYGAIQEGAFCPIVTLPQSWDDFLKGLSSNRREQFRRHYRLLQRSGKVKHETFILGMDAEQSLDRFISVYGTSWGIKQDNRFFSHLKEFVTKCSLTSLTQIDFLSVDGRDVSAFLHFRFDTKLLMYLMAVDKAFNKNISIGNIFVALCIEKAISDGFELYDFLKGSEDYKFHWSNGSRRSLAITLFQKRFSSFATQLITMLKDTARIIIR